MLHGWRMSTNSVVQRDSCMDVCLVLHERWALLDDISPEGLLTLFLPSRAWKRCFEMLLKRPFAISAAQTGVPVHIPSNVSALTALPMPWLLAIDMGLPWW